MLKFTLAIALILISGVSTGFGAVNSIVIGASVSGAYSGNFGPSLGHFVSGLADEYYGLSGFVLDENSYSNSIYEEYSELFGPATTVRLASLDLLLDIGTDKQLKLTASSTLESIAGESAKNYHSAVVEFSIAGDSDVVSTVTATSYTTLGIYDTSSNLLWSKGNGTTRFSLVKGAYSIQYTVYSEFASLFESLDLNLTFTLQNETPPPPGPTPPPGPEGTVPEPGSCIVFGLLAIGAASRRVVYKGKELADKS